MHDVERGEIFGYRGAAVPKDGHIVVVSGGTAHGIGLEAPTGDQSLKARAATLARGGLDAVGFVRSPFSIDGKQRLFAEPPHMQASMLFVPSGARVPRVGEEIEVRVRFTATDFDRVVVALSRHRRPQHRDHQPHQTGHPQQDRQPVGPHVVGDRRHERRHRGTTR